VNSFPQIFPPKMYFYSLSSVPRPSYLFHQSVLQDEELKCISILSPVYRAPLIYFINQCYRTKSLNVFLFSLQCTAPLLFISSISVTGRRVKMYFYSLSGVPRPSYLFHQSVLQDEELKCISILSPVYRAPLIYFINQCYRTKS